MTIFAKFTKTTILWLILTHCNSFLLLTVAFVSTQKLSYARKEKKKKKKENLFLIKVFASNLCYCVVQNRTA